MASAWQEKRNAEYRALLEKVKAKAVNFDQLEVGKCYFNYEGSTRLSYEGYLKRKTLIRTDEEGNNLYELLFKSTRKVHNRNGTLLRKRVYETPRLTNLKYDNYYECPCSPDDDPFERRLHVLAARKRRTTRRAANGSVPKSRSTSRNKTRSKSRSNNRT